MNYLDINIHVCLKYSVGFGVLNISSVSESITKNSHITDRLDDKVMFIKTLLQIIFILCMCITVFEIQFNNYTLNPSVALFK